MIKQLAGPQLGGGTKDFLAPLNISSLPLFSASLLLSVALSVEDFFALTFHCGGPHSMVGLACALEWLSAM